MAYSGITVTVNSRTYNDQSFLNNGHQTNFLRLISDTMVEIGGASDSATAAQAAQTAAEAAADTAASTVSNGLNTTSTTSLSVGTGSKSLTIADADVPFTTAMWVKLSYASDPTIYMWGAVTSFSGTTLGVEVEETGGSGTYASWVVSATGPKGEAGSLDLSTIGSTIAQNTLAASDYFAVRDASAGGEAKLTYEETSDMIYLIGLM